MAFTPFIRFCLFLFGLIFLLPFISFADSDYKIPEILKTMGERNDGGNTTRVPRLLSCGQYYKVYPAYVNKEGTHWLSSNSNDSDKVNLTARKIFTDKIIKVGVKHQVLPGGKGCGDGECVNFGLFKLCGFDHTGNMRANSKVSVNYQQRFITPIFIRGIDDHGVMCVYEARRGACGGGINNFCDWHPVERVKYTDQDEEEQEELWQSQSFLYKELWEAKKKDGKYDELSDDTRSQFEEDTRKYCYLIPNLPGPDPYEKSIIGAENILKKDTRPKFTFKIGEKLLTDSSSTFLQPKVKIVYGDVFNQNSTQYVETIILTGNNNKNKDKPETLAIGDIANPPYDCKDLLFYGTKKKYCAALNVDDQTLCVYEANDDLMLTREIGCIDRPKIRLSTIDITKGISNYCVANDDITSSGNCDPNNPPTTKYTKKNQGITIKFSDQSEILYNYPSAQHSLKREVYLQNYKWTASIIDPDRYATEFATEFAAKKIDPSDATANQIAEFDNNIIIGEKNICIWGYQNTAYACIAKRTGNGECLPNRTINSNVSVGDDEYIKYFHPKDIPSSSSNRELNKIYNTGGGTGFCIPM